MAHVSLVDGSFSLRLQVFDFLKGLLLGWSLGLGFRENIPY